MMIDTSAVDTNILIYLHDLKDLRKRAVAEEIMLQTPKISGQVLSEYLNVCRKLFDLSKEDLLIQTAELFADNDFIPVYLNTLLTASILCKKYHFNYSMRLSWRLH